MTRLDGKRTLITGGTSGIGLETARQFIAEGARVAVTGTNPKTLEEARTVLGEGALILRVDAADVDAQAGLARTVGEAFGGLDAVFINAGVADLRPLEAWDPAAFDRSMDINLRGPFFLI
jgi:NAD(P)-dependent dehydrogenase (short-subunit alcohol dehydrogenase family)